MAEVALEQDQLYVARRQYHLALQDVLTDFQFMEEALRMYISAAYELIRKRLAGALPFGLDDTSLERDALGRLIDKFSQLSANTEIVKTMRALLPRRNDFAHRGFLAVSHPETKVAEIDKAANELAELKKQTSACVKVLFGELEMIETLIRPAT